MLCLEEARAAVGGRRSLFPQLTSRFQLMEIFTDLPTWVLFICNSLTVISDMAEAGYIDADARRQLEPNLLFSYHRVDDKSPLHMVKGTFL